MFKQLKQLLFKKFTKTMEKKEITKQIFSSIDDICATYCISFEWLPAKYHKITISIFNGEIIIGVNECDDIILLNVFATYHFHITCDFALMKGYLQKGVKLNSDISMVKLAYYHNHYEKDYRIVTSLYENAIKLGNVVAIINLADYYFNAGYDDDKGEEMLLQLAEKDELLALLKLAEFYNTKNRGEEMVYYIIRVLECNNSQINAYNQRFIINAIRVLKLYYSNNLTAYCDVLKSIKNPNDIVILELDVM